MQCQTRLNNIDKFLTSNFFDFVYHSLWRKICHNFSNGIKISQDSVYIFGTSSIIKIMLQSYSFLLKEKHISSEILKEIDFFIDFTDTCISFTHN